MANKHLIGKHIIELKASSSHNLYAIQQKVSDIVWSRLLPLLDTLFDGLVADDEVVYLDHIELDIGSIHLESEFQIDQILEKITSLIEKEIREQIKVKHANQINGGFRFHNTNDKNNFSNTRFTDWSKKPTTNFNGEDVFNTDKKRNVNPVNTQSLRRHYFDLWLFWLKNGRLPSYTSSPDSQWISLVLETLGLDNDAVTMLETLLKKNSIALQRLVLQHSNQNLRSITELYTGFSQKRLLNLFKEIKQLFNKVSLEKSTTPTYRSLEIHIWQHIFGTVILERKKQDSLQLAFQAFKLPLVNTFINKPEIANEIKTVKADSSYAFIKEIEQKIKTTNHTEQQLILAQNDNNSNENRKVFSDNEETSSSIKDELESPQYFKNAGVVLLHPFLYTFFQKLGIVADNDFIDFNGKCKAIMLLHFLATAEETPVEYEMVLPKFLCQMPVNIPLDHTIKLTEEEKDEAQNLLQAVIAHWGVLGGTSPDGLREGFLMRQGKLEKTQTGWKLSVEKKTLDILLDKLPWNLSLIKLPWMSEILKVQWR